MKDYFELGTVVKPQGIKGEVKVDLYSDSAERVRSLSHVYMGRPGSLEKISVVSGRVDGKGCAYLTLEGCLDRNDAEKLRGAALYIDREHAAEIPEGSFYIEDLMGLTVKDSAGNVLGTLDNILQNGCTDVYCVKGDDSFMFPAVSDVFIERDVEKGIIVVDEKRLGEIAIYDI